MKKRNLAEMILSLALAGALLTGCGDNQNAEQKTQQDDSQSASQVTQQDDSQSASQVTLQDDSQSASQVTLQDDSQSASQVTRQGDTQNTSQETQKDDTQNTSQETGMNGTEAESEEKDPEISAGYEDNYAVDSKAAKNFAEEVKAAVARKDLEALAALTSFPVYVGLPDVSMVKTKEDFLNIGAESVFTDELVKSIEDADIDNFQPSMAGFSISAGGTTNINFGVVDGMLAITGINY